MQLLFFVKGKENKVEHSFYQAHRVGLPESLGTRRREYPAAYHGRHFLESVEHADGDTWLVGDKFILYRQASAPAEYLRDRPPGPRPSHVRLLYNAGDASAVWSFGDAFLKVKLTPPDFKMCHQGACHITKACPAETAI